MTDAEFVEAMTDLTGNLYQCAKRIEAVRGGSTAPSVCLSPAEFDRLVALARCGLRLAKDVSDGMDCLPSCNADAHDEICPFAHPEVAWRTLRQQLAGAARLADEVAALVRRGVLDARCPAADALLDYREPPATPRADRLASLDTQLADVGARLIWWRDRWTSEQARVRELEEVFSVERLRAAREHAHRTFNGGHEDDAMRRAFHHGMDTVFNMLDADAALARRAP